VQPRTCPPLVMVNLHELLLARGPAPGHVGARAVSAHRNVIRCNCTGDFSHFSMLPPCAGHRTDMSLVALRFRV
jgi:hypothetical protein